MRWSVRACVAAAAVVAGSAPASMGAPGSGAASVGAYDSEVKRSELRERAIELLESLSKHEEAQVRANAIEGLGHAPARAEGAVREGLRDRNLGVRFVAAFTAGKQRLKGVAPSLERLLTDESPDVRAAAIYALRRNGLDADPTPLAGMLESGDVRLRRNVAMILGEMGEASATGMLNAAAKSLTQPGTPAEQRVTRLTIAEALVKLGDPEAIHAVRAALFVGSERDMEGAVAAAQILGEVKDKESAGELVNRVELRVSAGAGEGSGKGVQPYAMPPEMRMAAALALGKMGYRDGAYVGEQYAGAPRVVWRSQAAAVLGETAGVSELSRLAGMMEDVSPMVRVSACAAVLKAVDRIAQTGR